MWTRSRYSAVPLYTDTQPMQHETLERWEELCHQAATEQNHRRFLELTREIIRMLTEKERRLSQIPRAGRTIRA